MRSRTRISSALDDNSASEMSFHISSSRGSSSSSLLLPTLQKSPSLATPPPPPSPPAEPASVCDLSKRNNARDLCVQMATNEVEELKKLVESQRTAMGDMQKRVEKFETLNADMNKRLQHMEGLASLFSLLSSLLSLLSSLSSLFFFFLLANSSVAILSCSFGVAPVSQTQVDLRVLFFKLWIL